MSQEEIMQATQRKPQSQLNKTGRAGYQAATIEAPNRPNKPDWDGFVKAATGLYGGAMKAKDDRSKERANQIIAELTPDERSEAIDKGLLLYSDDKKAMSYLRQMVGQQEAQVQDLNLQRLIRDGRYTTREEVDAHKAEFYTAAKADMAAKLGVNENDPDFMAGFNSNIGQRSVALYETLDQTESGRLETQAVMAVQKLNSQIIRDPAVIADPKNAMAHAAKIQAMYMEGTIARSNTLKEVIVNSVGQLAEGTNATDYLNAFGDSEVVLEGVQIKIRDVLGEAAFTSAITKSEESTIRKNTASNFERQERMSRASLMGDNGDYAGAYKLIEEIGRQLQITQPSDIWTPEKQQVQDLKMRVSTQQGTVTTASKNAAVKEGTIQNEAMAYLAAVQQRKSGGIGVLLDPSKMGFEYPKEAEQAAVKMMTQFINENDRLDDAGKRKATMDFIVGTNEGSVAREGLKSDGVVAMQELSYAVLGDDADINYEEAFPTMRGLYEVWKDNKQAFSMVDPAMATEFEMMGRLDLAGAKGLETLVKAKRQMANTDEQTVGVQREQFLSTLQSNEFKSNAEVSGKDFETALTIYRAQLSMKVNPTTAAKVAMEWISNNTEQIMGEGAFKSNGRVSKSFMMLDASDPDSYKEGQKAITEGLNSLTSYYPELDSTLWTVQEGANDMIVYQHLSGKAMLMPMGGIRSKYMNDKVEAAELAQQAARDKFTERQEEAATNTERNKNKERYEPEMFPDIFEGKAKITTSTYRDGKSPAEVERDVQKLNQKVQKLKDSVNFTTWRDGKDSAAVARDINKLNQLDLVTFTTWRDGLSPEENELLMYELNKSVGVKNQRKPKAQRGKGGRVKSQRN